MMLIENEKSIFKWDLLKCILNKSEKPPHGVEVRNVYINNQKVRMPSLFFVDWD